MKKIINEYALYLNNKNLSEKSKKDYLKQLDIFLKEYNINMSNVELLAANDFINVYYNNLCEVYKPQTINVKISALKNFCRFLMLNSYIPKAPILEYKNVKKDKNKVDDFNKEDLQTLLNWFKARTTKYYRNITDEFSAKREYVMVVMLFSLGLRIGELEEIRLSDIKGNVLGVRGKGYRGEISRHVLMGEKLMTLLEDYLIIRNEVELKEDEEFLWISSKTKKRANRRSFQVRLSQAEQELNIGSVYAHKLRHTCATQSIAAGKDIKVISANLGHSSTLTTETIYVNRDAYTLNDDPNTLDDIL